MHNFESGKVVPRTVLLMLSSNGVSGFWWVPVSSCQWLFNTILVFSKKMSAYPSTLPSWTLSFSLLSNRNFGLLEEIPVTSTWTLALYSDHHFILGDPFPSFWFLLQARASKDMPSASLSTVRWIFWRGVSTSCRKGHWEKCMNTFAASPDLWCPLMQCWASTT